MNRMEPTMHVDCPIERTLRVIGGRWKVLLLRELRQGTRRYSELRRGVPGVTHKMLARALRELAEDGIISRTVFPEIPPRVEYRLTAAGTELGPVLDALKVWGDLHTRPHQRAA